MPSHGPQQSGMAGMGKGRGASGPGPGAPGARPAARGQRAAEKTPGKGLSLKEKKAEKKAKKKILPISKSWEYQTRLGFSLCGADVPLSAWDTPAAAVGLGQGV